MKIFLYLASLFWFPKDIWILKTAAKTKGRNSAAGIAYRLRMLLYNSWIDPNSSFAGKPCFPHGISGIFISEGAICGKDLVIFQQVTIGSNMLMSSSKKGAPTIGDRCYIGAGAKIIGKCCVQNNCRIGANAVVTQDIPENTTVVNQNQVRIITHSEQMDNRFWRQKNGTIEYYENGAFR